MQEPKVFPLIRSVLVLLGSYLFGRNLFGHKLDEAIWQEIVGAVMVVFSFYWSFKTKTLTIEIFQSSILKVVMVAGALLVSSGKVTGDTLNGIIAILTAVIPLVYSYLSKKKSVGIETGKIPVSALTK